MKIQIDTATDGPEMALVAVGAITAAYGLHEHVRAMSDHVAAQTAQDPAAAFGQTAPLDPASAAFGVNPPEAGVPFVPAASATEPAAVASPAVPAAPAMVPAPPTPAHMTASPVPTDPAAVFPPPSAATAPDGATAPAPSAPATAPTAGATVDSRGLPWDERIHAKNKATVGDGSWRKKVGVSKDEVARIEAELRAGGAAPVPPAPAPAAVTPPPPPAAAPPVPVPPTPAPVASAAPVSAPSPAPAAPSPTPSADAPPAVRFAAMVRKVTGAQSEGRMQPVEVTTLLQQQGRGFASLSEVLGAELAGQAGIIAEFDTFLDALLATRAPAQ